MTTAIYLRVSTDDQTMDMQRLAIKNYLAQNPPDGPVEEYVDQGISGYSGKRPAFIRLLHDARSRRVRTVIVYKLDRLTRHSLTAIDTILSFDKLGVRFVSVSQPMFSHGTPFRHAIIAIFAELAQMERDMIAERVRAGMAAARLRGVRLGAPAKVTPDQAAKVLELRSVNLSYKFIAKEVGLSVGTCHRIAQARPPKADGSLGAAPSQGPTYPN